MIRKTAVTVCTAFALLGAAPTTASAAPTGVPCVGIGKVGIQSLVALINIGVQDIPILNAQQQQQCTGNGDDSLSHILDEVPVMSGNGNS